MFSFPALPSLALNSSALGFHPSWPKWTAQGLSFHGLLAFETPGLQNMAAWLKPPTQWADVGGVIGHPIDFEADIPLGITVLDGHLTIEDAVLKLHTNQEPWLTLGAVLQADVYSNSSLNPLFLVEGELFTDHICIEGELLPARMPEGHWSIPIGDVELNVGDAYGRVCYYKHPTQVAGTNFSVTGAVGGAVRMGPVMLAAEVKFPAPDGCLAFVLNVSSATDGGGLSLNTLTSSLLSSVEDIPIMGELVHEVLDVEFSNMSMTLEPVCKQLRLHATVSSAFFLTSELELDLSLGFSWPQVWRKIDTPAFWASLQSAWPAMPSMPNYTVPGGSTGRGEG